MVLYNIIKYVMYVKSLICITSVHYVHERLTHMPVYTKFVNSS